MKKKVIFIILGILIIICAVVGFYFYSNRTVATITLDINPSIEIHLKKNNLVKEIIPLNDDAKEIVSSDMNGKDLNDTMNLLTKNVVEKGYDKDGIVEVLVWSEGIDNKEVESIIFKSCEDNNVGSNIKVVENVTEEDKEFANKHNISPAKASYINDVTKEKDNIEPEALVEKPINELEDAKERGVYCDEGYTLEGDFCVKEIGRESLKEGKICPQGYFEYDGKCYEEAEGTTTDKLVCFKDETLENGKCYRRETVNAIAAKTECTKGEEKTKGELGIQNREGTDANEKVCVDLSKTTHPVSPCELNDGTEWTKSGGKCYWHKAPIIATGCPGKIKVNGFCWDDASNVLICKGARDGKQYKSRNDYCEKSIKIIEPTVTEYRCEDDFILEGNKCKREIVHDSHNEKICPSGYTLLDSGQCINKKKTANKIDGSYCENPDSRREGNECVIYKRVEAKK